MSRPEDQPTGAGSQGIPGPTDRTAGTSTATGQAPATRPPP